MLRQRIPVTPTTWRGSEGGTRVLIEHHDPNVGVAIGNLLAAEGYAVATCCGPTDRHPCPLSNGADCREVDEADVVLFGLEVEDEVDRDVLAGLKASVPNTPIVVEIPPTRVALYQPELEDCVAVPRPMSRDALLDAIQRALR